MKWTLTLLIAILGSCSSDSNHMLDKSEKIGWHVIPDGMGCFVTNEVTKKERLVGYMYREASEFEQDSGWRIFAGDETDEYMDNPDNTRIFDLNTLIEFDGAITAYLDLPVGSEVERIEGTNTFREIENN
jgi:hypothetical protein